MSVSAFAAPPRGVAVLPAADYARRLPPQALCTFQASPATDGDPRRVVLPLPALIGADRVELWPGAGEVACGYADGFGWSADGAALMVQAHVPEAALEPIEDTACALYRRLLAFARGRGCPHLWRIWHYLGGITQGEGDAERYRRFCVGRHRALAERDGFEAQVPAATAVGAAGGGLTLVALAGRQAGRQLENPRQTSAYRYPRDYGPRSPSFARATLLRAGASARLLVSGTASIVGHASVHVGDPAAQLRQIAHNLAALTAAVPAESAGLQPLSYALYLRHAADLPLLEAPLAELFGGAPLRAFEAELCRRELLVEVEAVYGTA